MKKIFKYIPVLVAVLFLAASCNVNEDVLFQSEDANVGFPSSTLQVIEGPDATIDVEVVLAGLPGSAVTVNVSVSTEGLASPAVEGSDFEITSGKTLTFEEGYGTKYVSVKVLDNDVYTGNKSFILVLDEVDGLKKNTSYMATVTISDDEHPLKLVIGSFSATGVSYFNGDEAFTVTTEVDPEDASKLWFNGLVNGIPNLPIYGIVDLEAMEIKIPVGQSIYEDDTNPAKLSGFYGPDGADAIEEGGFITGNISEDGSITIADEYGAEIISGANEGYWFNIYTAGNVLTKD